MIRIVFMGQYAIFGAMVTNYALNYGASHWQLSKQMLLGMATVCLICGLIVQPAWASMSDKLGRRPVYLASMIGLVILFPIMFYVIRLKNVVFLWIIFVVMGFISLGGNVVQAAMYTEMFPTEVRMAGYAISTQIGNIIVGFTPMISALLVREGAFGWVPVIIFTSIMMGLGIISCLTHEETKGTIIV